MARTRTPPARLRGTSEVNRRACLLVQLEMSSDEVRVKVREDDVANRQSALGGE
jgi:hypothetical protein